MLIAEQAKIFGKHFENAERCIGATRPHDLHTKLQYIWKED